MEDSQELLEGVGVNERESKMSQNYRESVDEDDKRKLQADFYLRKVNRTKKDNYVKGTKS